MEDKKTPSAMQAVSDRIKHLKNEATTSRFKAVAFLGAAALSGLVGYEGAIDGDSFQAITGAIGTGGSTGFFVHHNIEARQSAMETAALSAQHYPELQEYEKELQTQEETQTPPQPEK